MNEEQIREELFNTAVNTAETFEDESHKRFAAFVLGIFAGVLMDKYNIVLIEKD